MVRIANSKYDKSRQILLHHTTIAVLRDYSPLRDHTAGTEGWSAFFVSASGRLVVNTIDYTFADLLGPAGIHPASRIRGSVICVIPSQCALYWSAIAVAPTSKRSCRCYRLGWAIFRHEGGPPLLIGGGGDATNRRVVDFGAGWISGGGDVEQFAQTARGVRTAWKEAGRDGSPRLVALGYFALGDGAAVAARTYLGHYYGFSGEYAKHVISGAMKSRDEVVEAIGAFSAAGCDELIMFPCIADPEQVDHLAVAANLKPGSTQ